MNDWSKIIAKSRDRVARIFLSLGALQTIAIEQLTSDDTEQVQIVISFVQVDIDLPPHVFLVCYPNESKFSQLRFYSDCYHYLTQLKKSAKELHVAIPHAYHAMANFLAFTLKPTSVDLLPDGLLNYYHSTLTPVQKREMWKKRVTAAVLGGRYKAFSGDLLASKCIPYRNNYTFSQKGLITDVGKLVNIRLPANELCNEAPNPLFIDQPLNHLDDRDRESIVQAVHKYLSNETSVIYKPHRSQVTSNLILPDRKLQILTKEETVEKIVSDLGVSEVIGMFSTALLTIKLMHPDLPSTSIGFNIMVRNRPELSTVRDLMANLGVKILDA